MKLKQESLPSNEDSTVDEGRNKIFTKIESRSYDV
jgi:hypothetical protein